MGGTIGAVEVTSYFSVGVRAFLSGADAMCSIDEHRSSLIVATRVIGVSRLVTFIVWSSSSKYVASTVGFKFRYVGLLAALVS